MGEMDWLDGRGACCNNKAGPPMNHGSAYFGLYLLREG